MKISTKTGDTLAKAAKSTGAARSFIVDHLVEQYRKGRAPLPGASRREVLACANRLAASVDGSRNWQSELFGPPSGCAYVAHDDGEGGTFAVAWEDDGKWVAEELTARDLTGGGVAQVDSEGRLRVFYACGSVTLHENNKKGADDDR